MATGSAGHRSEGHKLRVSLACSVLVPHCRNVTVGILRCIARTGCKELELTFKYQLHGILTPFQQLQMVSQAWASAGDHLCEVIEEPVPWNEDNMSQPAATVGVIKGHDPVFVFHCMAE